MIAGPRRMHRPAQLVLVAFCLAAVLGPADGKGSKTKKKKRKPAGADFVEDDSEDDSPKWRGELEMEAVGSSGLQMGVVHRPKRCRKKAKLGQQIKLHYETRLQVCAPLGAAREGGGGT